MTQKNTNQMQRLLLSLLPIQALAAGLPAINSLLNGFVVGHYLGSTALAAIGFAGPLTYLFNLIGNTLANGSQLKSGQYLGRGDRDGLLKTFNSTWICAAIVGLLVSAALFLFSSGVSLLLGASEELMKMTRDYICGLAPSVVLSVLFSCLLSFLQLDRASAASTVSVAVILVVNTGFNFLNVYLLHWGIFGVGLSTSLANLAAVLVCVFHFLFKSKVFRFSLRAFDMKMLRSVLYLGLPSAVTPLCSFLRDRILNHFIFLLGGTTAMAAMTIAMNLSNSLGASIEGGYSSSSNLLTSVLVGERDVETLRKLPRTMIMTSFPIYAVAYVIVFALAKPLALLFGAEPERIALYVTAIRLVNIWYLTNSLKTPSISIYRALDKVKLVSVCYVLNVFVYPVACALLSKQFGLNMIFNYPWISELLLCAFYIAYYIVRRRKLPRSIFKITDIPHTLAVPSADRYSMTIRNVPEAMRASEDVAEFCKTKGLPKKTASMCSLCVEEMAVDSVLHGFIRGKENVYSIELRVIYENGEVSVMLRDNCPHFDPQEWLTMYADQDPERSLGIRLAAECAREMNYTSTLGLNVINIKV